MANVKIPYALVPAVALETRYANMQSAIARGLPRLQRTHIDDTKTLHLACYGPSLKDTWQELQHPILSMSGSTKFLVERGITPDFHLDMDPRENKAMTSLPAVPGVKYLVASVSAPKYFDALMEAGADVVLWHTVSSNWDQDLAWVEAHDVCETCGAPPSSTCGHPTPLVVSTGSTIGLGAIHLGGILGFRRFEIHGMDGSFAEDQRHAGIHHGRTQKPDITWQALNIVYRTSKIMANAVAETINTAKNFPIVTVWHGHGLTQALIRKANLDNACCADETEKRVRLSGLRPHIVNAPPLPKHNMSFWDAILGSLQPTDLPELVANIAVCEPRRALAKYNTGSIPFETVVQLRALTRFYQPSVIAEVGTFIGASTLAMVQKRVTYTCDQCNDCVPFSENLIPHPYQSSTQMLREMQESVDFFFFDGRIQDEDLPEIQRLSHPATVYAFDDYAAHEKGVTNVKKISRLRPGHVLFPPDVAHKGRTMLAVMVPKL